MVPAVWKVTNIIQLFPKRNKSNNHGAVSLISLEGKMHTVHDKEFDIRTLRKYQEDYTNLTKIYEGEIMFDKPTGYCAWRGIKRIILLCSLLY